MRYRKHRISLKESLNSTKEYSTIDEMKKDISNEYFDINDIIIGDEVIYDKRIGYSYSFVYIKRFGDKNFIKKIESMRCIGMVEVK
jgi:hypothetical protein